jgi:prepilin-type N-terminal cleavage/methylation domain-containing protein
MTTRNRTRATGGFTLVEVLVSMTLLSVASLALGSMLFRAARQATAASQSTYQTASLNGQVDRLQALPFDQLAAGTTCVNLTAPVRGTQCTTITNVSTKVKQVSVVMTPSGNALLHPITTTFTRTISGNAVNPLKN